MYIFNSFQIFLSHYLNDYVTIIFWAGALSILSMYIYKIFSPQKKLILIKEQLQTVQEQMNDEALMDKEAPKVLVQLLLLSFKKVGMTFFPALLSGIPILFMWGFLSFHFDYTPPNPGERVLMKVSPNISSLYFNQDLVEANKGGEIAVIWPQDGGIHLKDQTGSELFYLDQDKPEYFLNKKQWWNVFLPSPYGYLGENVSISELSLQLSNREYLPFGPSWLRSWCVIFMISMLIFSSLIKFVFKIE